MRPRVAATLNSSPTKRSTWPKFRRSWRERLGRDAAQCVGQPLTALFRLVEEDDGRMPLLAALASRSAVEAQRAIIRGRGPDEVIIDATPLADAAGQFAGFHATLRGDDERDGVAGESAGFRGSLDEALRSPLDADHFRRRPDRRAKRRATAVRLCHLCQRHRRRRTPFAVGHPLHGCGRNGRCGAGRSRRARAGSDRPRPVAGRGARNQDNGRCRDTPCRANGEARAIVQILVNIIGNAVRHSPDDGRVAVSFADDGNERR